MKFYILASLIIFCMVIAHNRRKSSRIRERSQASFWQKEKLANETRRKPLDNLEYIQIPLEELPVQTLQEVEEVADCVKQIRELSYQPIVNLTGYSNTDLKLEYGAANITVLSQYDQSYTMLVSTLQKWAALLYQAGYVDETRQILEFAVSTRTDVGASYTLLAQIYREEGHPEKIARLSEVAETLLSMNKDIILRKLQEI